MRLAIPLSASFAILALSGCGMADYGMTSAGTPAPCPAGTQVVTVGAGATGMSFSPASLTVHANDTVCWTWASGPHSVVSGTACTASGAFCSPSDAGCAAAPTAGPGTIYTHRFASTGTFPYFCSVHCAMGMTGTITVVP